MNNATEYALSIAGSLQMLDEIHNDWWKNDVATTAEVIRDAAAVEEDHNEHDRLLALAQFLDNEYAGETDNIGDAYLDLSLDVWTNIEWRWDHQEIKSVSVLVTSGGPHATLKYGGYEDDVLVEVTWGSEVATRWVSCAPIAQAMAFVWESTEAALK